MKVGHMVKLGMVHKIKNLVPLFLPFGHRDRIGQKQPAKVLIVADTFRNSCEHRRQCRLERVWEKYRQVEMLFAQNIGLGDRVPDLPFAFVKRDYPVEKIRVPENAFSPLASFIVVRQWLASQVSTTDKQSRIDIKSIKERILGNGAYSMY